MKHKILVIEDDMSISNFLVTLLRAENYEVISASEGRLGYHLSLSHQPDIIILDLGLPDIDGIEWIRQYRNLINSIILVVTAKDDHPSKVEALDLGADDYLTKPFNPAELLARIRVGLRHRSSKDVRDVIFEFKDLKVNLQNYEVVLRGSTVHCTPIEFQLLAYLIEHQGKVCTSNMLVKKVWGEEAQESNLANLRVVMANLRRKIEKDTASPEYIVTVLGVGYRFVG
ncbi:MAG TPA: DNA-binding response regulator [Erysipelotrichaceae bacterium]|nr:DNA-binding response regulator [Erysipelotrichaceae bacterium]